MPTLNINDMLGGVNVFGPNGLNTNLQQHQAAETPPTRPAAGAHGVWVERDPGVLNADVVTTADTTDMLVGHHHAGLNPIPEAIPEAIQESMSALEECVGELDATNDDIYQKLDEHERRLSMNENKPEVAMPEVEDKETILSISKTSKTTEVVVSNAILESISSLVKKG